MSGMAHTLRRFPGQKAHLLGSDVRSEVGEDVENPGEVQMGFLTLGHQLPQAQLVPSGPRCVPVGV